MSAKLQHSNTQYSTANSNNIIKALLVMVNKPVRLVYLAFLSVITVYSYSVLLGSDSGANERSNNGDEWYLVSPEMLHVARQLNVEERVSSAVFVAR